jgi:hypothetical protein
MRAFAFAVAAGVLVALPLPTTAAPLSTDLSSQSVQIGPGGVRVHDRYDSRRRDRVVHDRYDSRRRDRVIVRGPRGGGQCAELRRACLNKERLGEQGEGNCRRYRALCR